MNIYRILLGNSNSGRDIGTMNAVGQRLIGVDKNGWEEWLVLIEPNMTAAQHAYDRALEAPSSCEEGRVVVEAAFGGLL